MLKYRQFEIMIYPSKDIFFTEKGVKRNMKKNSRYATNLLIKEQFGVKDIDKVKISDASLLDFQNRILILRGRRFA